MKGNKKRRKYKRPFGQRPYRKLFIITTEGSVTEPEYFSMFNNENNTIQIKCIRSGKKSDPKNVLKRMKKYVTDNPLKKDDEAWLIVDKDKWKNEQLNELSQWSKLEKKYGFAVSNPLFEYWLLLHFEEGDNITSSSNCQHRLKKYLPDYDKQIDVNKIKPGISEAISRAKQKDNPCCKDWPRKTGTTVYRLVEKLV